MNDSPAGRRGGRGQRSGRRGRGKYRGTASHGGYHSRYPAQYDNSSKYQPRQCDNGTTYQPRQYEDNARYQSRQYGDNSTYHPVQYGDNYTYHQGQYGDNSTYHQVQAYPGNYVTYLDEQGDYTYAGAGGMENFYGHSYNTGDMYATSSGFSQPDNDAEGMWNNEASNFTQRQSHKVANQKGKDKLPTRKKKSSGIEDEISQAKKNEDKASRNQRDSLIEELKNETYECMVCCDRVRHTHGIWSCVECYHIFHLRCIQKWASSQTSPTEEDQAVSKTWRCPGCQTINENLPNSYFCFCGKVREPMYERRETPHSCGEVCQKKRIRNECPHPCNVLCHPGPCPPCTAYVTRYCKCMKISKTMRCDSAEVFSCEKLCGQKLACSDHACSLTCHSPPCPGCNVTYIQECHCGNNDKQLLCGEQSIGEVGDDGTHLVDRYSCGNTCTKLLSCGEHYCICKCHPPPCASCNLLPEHLTHCACGTTPLGQLGGSNSVAREKCTDPVPTCQQICGKILSCGGDNKRHHCESKCHTGSCPPCPYYTLIKCRCGNKQEEIECSKITTGENGDEFVLKCKRRCKAKKLCGRHKCQEECCVDKDHECDVICGRKLTCNLHTCDEVCHRGNCPTCWRVCFDELTCECGDKILFPPIQCGMKPPDCNKPCIKPRTCGHDVLHTCHTQLPCPPCTVLTDKQCNGGHTVRSNIPCHQKIVSCGVKCGKELPCKQHRCTDTCHKGDCSGYKKCNQKCNMIRSSSCGHPCGAKCHGLGPCPSDSENPCLEHVNITCLCGNRKMKMICSELKSHTASNYNKLTTAALASQMHQLSTGGTVDISGVTQIKLLRPDRIECNEQCALIERNKRLASALQITDPELTNRRVDSSYTDFLKDMAKQNVSFASEVERKIIELVQSLKTSNQMRKSHSFPSMNREKRRFVHELAECYGCLSEAHDPEPHRNVDVTAIKEKSFMTSKPLIQQQISRPMVKQLVASTASASPKSATLPTSSSLPTRSRPLSQIVSGNGKKDGSKPVIDYFDME